jgi:hypothetical protein
MNAMQDVNRETAAQRRVRQAYARRNDALQYQAVPNAHIFHVQERERQDGCPGCARTTWRPSRRSLLHASTGDD